MVPSSNPESQDLFEEDVLAYHRRETEEIVSEHFEPFDLHNEQVDGAEGRSMMSRSQRVVGYII